MNFFEHQDRARKKTGRLFFYFFLAVLCIFGALYALASFFLSRYTYSEKIVWDAGLALKVGLGTLIIVGLGSLYKVASLAGGGKVVAESLGGRLLSPNTKDLVEKRILNVVEEMAIASGCPVPPVYLMEEKAINAFAAGYSPKNAVIGVTRGCAEKLNRDQLQGVMAHEFSHILNGDMRINIRLIGILHGILLIASIGYFMMRIGSYSSRGRNREGGGLGMALLVGGLGMLIIGYIGSFFGGLIKAAVSRQREFLADASAVQFTRYPEGIAGALKKIGGFSEGAKIESPNAAECSHLFFGSALNSLFATHPPLNKRILQIEPRWKGELPNTDTITEKPDASEFSGASRLSSNLQGGDKTPQQSQSPSIPDLGETISSAGNPTEKHFVHARNIISQTPENLLQMAREPFTARCVIFALLLDENDHSVRKRQLEFLQRETEKGTTEETENAETGLKELSSEKKFALIELSAPALLHLSQGQYAGFRNTVEHLAAADGKLDLFEWSIRKVIDHDLGLHYSQASPPHGKHTVRNLLEDCILVLGALARHGQDGADPKPAFSAGASQLTQEKITTPPDASACGVAQINEAMERLESLCPTSKAKLLEACSRTIAHDGKVTDIEVQILRGVAAGLSCPLPPYA